MTTLGHPCRRSVLGFSLATGAMVARLPARAAEGPTSRIVSIGGGVTEILYALGLGADIVAVDTTSRYPAEALATKPNVGYMRRLSAEGILSVRPSLLIADEGAGPPDALRLVREAGVPAVIVPEDASEAGVAVRINAVAQAVDRSSRSATLVREVAVGFADLSKLRSRIGRPTRALFILSLQNGRTIVAGRKTSPDGMLALAGAENVARALEGFKPMSDEAILTAQPEAVVMIPHGPGGGPPVDLFNGIALSRTPAARDNHLVTMDGSYLLGFGPRTPKAARELLIALHPSVSVE